VARPRNEGVETETAAAKEEEGRRGKEGGRSGRGLLVLPEEEEVRRRFRPVHAQVGLWARVGTRCRTKDGRGPVWRSKEAFDANMVGLISNSRERVGNEEIDTARLRSVLPILRGAKLEGQVK